MMMVVTSLRVMGESKMSGEDPPIKEMFNLSFPF